MILKKTATELNDFIDWNFLFVEWDLHGRIPDIFSSPKYGKEARTLYEDALSMLPTLKNPVYAMYKGFKAYQKTDDIVLKMDDGTEEILPQLRNQTTHYKSLSDYVGSEGDVVLFAVTTRNTYHSKDDYLNLMSSILCDRLTDAMLTFLEKQIHTDYGRKPLSIAYGYPAAPDHSGKKKVYDILNVQSELDLTLSENFSMSPTSSMMGFIIPNDNAKYFAIGKIGEDQIEDYSKRAGLTPERLKELIPNNI